MRCMSGPLVFLFLALGTGCGGGDSPDMASVPFDMNGTWASRVVDSQMFSGLLGTDTVTITTYARVQITQSGTSIAAMQTECSVSVTPYKGNVTTYPDAAVASIPVMSTPGTLSAAFVGATYTAEQQVQLVGWKTQADPKTDPLPTLANDARVFDADGDGNPGVTLKVSGGLAAGDIYVVNRSLIDLSGTVLSANRIAGPSHTLLEQTVVGANPMLLKQQVTATPNPDAAASTFTLSRLVAGKDTCADIITEAPGRASFGVPPRSVGHVQ